MENQLYISTINGSVKTYSEWLDYVEQVYLQQEPVHALYHMIDACVFERI